MAATSAVYKRVLQKKIESGKTWDQIAQEANIPVASWMTGVPFAKPSDKELKAIAPVLDTTYEWLKYGR